MTSHVIMCQATRLNSKGGVDKNMAEKLLTLDDLANYLSVSVRTVYRLMECNRLPACRDGCHFRFRREDIDRWLEANKIVKTKTG